MAAASRTRVSTPRKTQKTSLSAMYSRPKTRIGGMPIVVPFSPVNHSALEKKTRPISATAIVAMAK